jgi:hypothetical protein
MNFSPSKDRPNCVVIFLVRVKLVAPNFNSIKNHLDLFIFFSLLCMDQQDQEQQMVDEINRSGNKDEVLRVLQRIIALATQSPMQGMTDSGPMQDMDDSQGAQMLADQARLKAKRDEIQAKLEAPVQQISLPTIVPYDSRSPESPDYVSRILNKAGKTRQQMLDLINQQNYNSQGRLVQSIGLDGKPIRYDKGWADVQSYISGNTYGKGAQLKFNTNTLKYYGGRRRMRRTRRR